MGRCTGRNGYVDPSGAAASFLRKRPKEGQQPLLQGCTCKLLLSGHANHLETDIISNAIDCEVSGYKHEKGHCLAAGLCRDSRTHLTHQALVQTSLWWSLEHFP